MFEKIAENIERIKGQLQPQVTLVAVSKFHPVEAIAAGLAAGHFVYGESRVQELTAKVPQLSPQVRWHFIGHLQSNKVRQLLRLPVSLIHSVDSLRLLRAIDAEAVAQGRAVDVLLELHVAREATKSGFAPDEALALADSNVPQSLRATRVRGIMAMASLTDDVEQVSREFRTARAAFEALQPSMGAAFDTVSMGMSDDWHVAVDCGTTMVRIGSAIFGPRL